MDFWNSAEAEENISDDEFCFLLVGRVTNKVKCLIVITKDSIISAVKLCLVGINKDLITT